MEIHTLGIDLGKTIFHLVRPGRARRGCGAQDLLASAAATLYSEPVGPPDWYEACGGAHFLGREVLPECMGSLFLSPGGVITMNRLLPKIMALGSEQACSTGLKGSIVQKVAVGRSVSNLKSVLRDIRWILEANNCRAGSKK